MSLFAFTNWLAVGLVAIGLAGIYINDRSLFVKPAITVCAYFHVFFQWPLVLLTDEIVAFLPDPFVLTYVLHIPVLVCLVAATFTFRGAAREVWSQATGDDAFEAGFPWKPALALAAGVLGVIVLYLREVPFRETGLYTIFTNPVLAAVARERSLKVIDSQLLAYAYFAMASSAAPILAAMVALNVRRALRRRRPLVAAASLLVIVLLMVAVSLSGGRTFAVNLLLVSILVPLVARGLPFQPFRYLAIVPIVLAPAIVLTVARTGGFLAAPGFLVDFVEAIFDRAFLVPFEVGTWYVHAAETAGYFGVEAVPKLASLLGRPSIDATNLVGRAYTASRLETVSAGAGFLFTYYSFFGLAAIPLSIVGILLLDLALLVLRYVAAGVLVPVLAVLMVNGLAFIAADYTSVLLTHGFGVTVALAAALEGVRRVRLLPARRPAARWLNLDPALGQGKLDA